jgi:hypothetical protein
MLRRGVLCNVAGVGISGVSPVGVAEIDRARRRDFRQWNPNDDPPSRRRRCPTIVTRWLILSVLSSSA